MSELHPDVERERLRAYYAEYRARPAAPCPAEGRTGSLKTCCWGRSERMRDGFHDIVSGWTLHSGIADLTERIDAAALWTKANGPLEPDEEATVKLMIEAQIARTNLFTGEEEVEPRVFSHCNVCGRVLHSRDEDEMGMCEGCAAE